MIHSSASRYSHAHRAPKGVGIGQDYYDEQGTRPEFDGTCMKRHGATKWLSTVAPVQEQEEITLVFAIFDLSDSRLDSFVLVDNFRWLCDGKDTPETRPEG